MSSLLAALAGVEEEDGETISLEDALPLGSSGSTVHVNAALVALVPSFAEIVML